MPSVQGAVTFFDLGNTLAAVQVSSTGDRIESLAVYPYVPRVLQNLRAQGVRLGIISNRGSLPEEQVNEALKAAGLYAFFDPELVIYGAKDSPRIFEQAAQHAGGQTAERRMLFVGEDAAERVQARKAGFLVAPHPVLALSVLQQAAHLRYLRISVPVRHAEAAWRQALGALPIVPVHTAVNAGPVMYTIADDQTAARLDDLGFNVDRLGGEDEPLTTDLYLLRDDHRAESGFLIPEGNATFLSGLPDGAGRILSSAEEGLYVAVPGDRTVENYHFPGTWHGHNLKLVPSTSLFEPIGDTLAAKAAVGSRLFGGEQRTGLAPLRLRAAEKKALQAAVTPERLQEMVERYTGMRSIDGAGTLIHSRHILHADNARAVNALVADLTRIGDSQFTVSRHRFTHEGRAYENVEAKLLGMGLDGIVLVTAHMDSTGARQPGYRAATDAAPGADDDCSGMAGVLVAAEAIRSMAATFAVPRRTVQFVLFNAEEHGLVGSRAYARDQAAARAPIVAAFQMDMIGYDVQPSRTFELHAGFRLSATVKARSVRLARALKALVPGVSPSLPAPQLYSGDSPDPAEARSDHYSFQVEGYAACLASEDFFAGPGAGSSQPEPNPNYHLPADTFINFDYAADIARVVIAAAWVAATQ
jgi:leucyl aminopeptidase